MKRDKNMTMEQFTSACNDANFCPHFTRLFASAEEMVRLVLERTMLLSSTTEGRQKIREQYVFNILNTNPQKSYHVNHNLLSRNGKNIENSITYIRDNYIKEEPFYKYYSEIINWLIECLTARVQFV